MAVRNGKVFGQTVNEATTPPTPTPLTDFTAAFGAVTVDCASVTIQGNANVFVTVRTNTDQLLEVACTLNNFPTSCGGTVVNLGVIPMAIQSPASLRSSVAPTPAQVDRTPIDAVEHSARREPAAEQAEDPGTVPESERSPASLRSSVAPTPDRVDRTPIDAVEHSARREPAAEEAEDLLGGS